MAVTHEVEVIKSQVGKASPPSDFWFEMPLYSLLSVPKNAYQFN